MKIIIAGGMATISADRKEAKRLGAIVSESDVTRDGGDLYARTGLVPEFLVQLFHLLVRTKEQRLWVATPLFRVEQIIAADQAWRACLELLFDGDVVTIRVAREGLRALGESTRLAAQDLSRAEYFIRTGVAQADALGLAEIMTTNAEVLDVTVPLNRGQEELENPRYPREPPPPGTVRPSSRFMRAGPYLKVYDREEGEWIPEGGLRGGWVVPSTASRPCPRNMHIFEMDMVTQPGMRMTYEPNALYRVSLPGGIEVDYYTDPWAQARYVETVPGTIAIPNPVLDDPQPVTTYVVHPADGRYAAVVRTDDRARMIEIVNDPVAPFGSYGQAAHRFVTLLGGWPGRLGLGALLGSLGGSAVASLDAVAGRLISPLNDGRYAGVRLRASYDNAGAVPSRLQVDCSIDGQTSSEHVPNG